MPPKLSDHVLGIEITEHSLKWVQRVLSSNTIDFVHIEPLESEKFDMPGYLSGVLRTTARRHRRSLKTAEAVLSIPAYMGRTVILTLDPGESDLHGAIEWELEQQSVGQRSRYWFDHQPLTPPEGRHLVSAVEEGLAAFIVSSLRKARLIPSAFQPEIVPYCNLYFHTHPAAEGLAGLVDIDARRTLLCLVQDGRFCDSDFILAASPKAHMAPEPFAKTLPARFQEMARDKGVEGDLKKIYLSGDHFADIRFRDAFLGALAAPAEVLEPFHHLNLSDGLKSELSPLAPALAIAAGLTLFFPFGHGGGMITLDLLKYHRAPLKPASEPRRIPLKRLLFIFAVIVISLSAPTLWRMLQTPSGESPVVKVKRIQKLERTETPFDVVEDIVDDVYGGRFKVKSLYRLSSPAHLTPNEKKVYERFFVKNSFEALNGAVRSEMGFNTVSLDNLGNFFVFGLTPSRVTAENFRKELLQQRGFLSADELEFQKREGQDKLLFALKGFLGYDIIDQFYEDSTWKKEEVLAGSARTVLETLQADAVECGIPKFKNVEWEAGVPFGPAYRHGVKFQMETSYGALMKWIRRVFEQNLQVGYSRLTVVSVASKKIIVGLEMSVYARQ